MDILIISENKSEFTKTKKYESKLERSLQLFVYTDIKEIKNKHLLNNMLNGIIIQGRIKWI